MASSHATPEGESPHGGGGRDGAGRPESPYVGRGGLKLEHALRTFALDPTGLVCADFGCNVGGFTDCLLRHGAAQVHALDTGYGALDWKLRNDPRVIVRERTNALHAEPPAGEVVSLIAIDMGWTPQRLCIPAALRWLAPRGRIITLIKPHYEAEAAGLGGHLRGGILDESAAPLVCERVLSTMPALGAVVLGVTASPILGGAGKGKRGNHEFLAVLGRAGEGV